MSAYQIDLDPVHSVIRLTVTAETDTPELAEEIYQRLSKIASSGGPYAAIYDLSAVKATTIPTEMIRASALRPRSIPMGRPHVIVGKEPVIFGLARLFQMSAETTASQDLMWLSGEHGVVHTLEEAYEIVGVLAEDFTQRLS